MARDPRIRLSSTKSSRVICEMVVAPVSAIAARSSFSIRPSKFSTPPAPIGGKGVNERTTEHRRVGAQCEQARDVETGTDAGIDQDLELSGHLVRDRRQGASRRQNPVKLPAAMVRDDDSVRAEPHGILRVGRIETPLDDHRALPEYRTHSMSFQEIEGSKFAPSQPM